MSFQDLTGQKFGKLTVIKRAENHITKGGQVLTMWVCQCDCGNQVIVRSYHLKTGHTKSCGCYHKEKLLTAQKKYNKYDLSGEYGIGYTLKGEKFYFDLEDYDKIKDYCWYSDNYGYLEHKGKEHIILHRLIMDAPKGLLVDHINHDVKDNRKSNLRICTKPQNNWNAKTPTNNTSGVKGVHYNKRKNKWSASITVNNKVIFLGYYSNKEDATKVRKEAEKQYFEDFNYKQDVRIEEVKE